MISKFPIFRNLLLASVALAVPPSWPGLAHGGENRQSRSLTHVNSRSDFTYVSSSTWAGSVLSGSSGTFTSVQASFTVPTLMPSTNEEGVSVTLGIDGAKCTEAFLQAGVKANVTGDGVVSYGAWFRFHPDYKLDYFEGVDVHGGDLITINVTALTTTDGSITIKNLSTSQSSAMLLLKSSETLCEQNAEWIVEDYYLPNSALIPLAHFNELIFTDAAASDANWKSHSPSEGDIYNIVQIPISGPSGGPNSDQYLYAFASVNQYDVRVQRLTW